MANGMLGSAAGGSTLNSAVDLLFGMPAVRSQAVRSGVQIRQLMANCTGQ